jgi:methionyl aminopeptidase
MTLETERDRIEPAVDRDFLLPPREDASPMLMSQRRRQAEKDKRQGLRAAGRFNAEVMDYIRPFVRAGITTGEIDHLVREYTLKHGHTPAPLNYLNFPKSCCTSVNEVICHGIPGEYVLADGDIVNVDITTIVDGWHGDQSETFLIGNVSDEARAVVQCAFDCLYAAIDAAKPNCRIADIGVAIVRIAHARGFSVVKDYVGHGVGRKFHQEPTISHVPTAEGRRQRLSPGVSFTIEPMINVGVADGDQDQHDGWTVRTRDGRLSAQFEHTILMTNEGPEILTLTKHGPQKGHRF